MKSKFKVKYKNRPSGVFTAESIGEARKLAMKELGLKVQDGFLHKDLSVTRLNEVQDGSKVTLTNNGWGINLKW